MPYGCENWPGPLPVAPHFEMNVPSRSNRWTRLFSVSTT